MNDHTSEFRPLMIRARSLGRALLSIYETEDKATPADLLELLDIAEARLASAGYKPADLQQMRTSTK